MASHFLIGLRVNDSHLVYLVTSKRAPHHATGWAGQLRKGTWFKNHTQAQKYINDLEASLAQGRATGLITEYAFAFFRKETLDAGGYTIELIQNTSKSLGATTLKGFAADTPLLQPQAA